MVFLQKLKNSWDRDRESWGFGILLFLLHVSIWLLLEHTFFGIIFCLFLLGLYFYLDHSTEFDEIFIKLSDVGFDVFEGTEKKASFFWDELIRIEVLTGAAGPWNDDVWIELHFEDDFISLPMGLVGLEKIIPEFSKLPGYNDKQFIAAMGSTKDQSFLCFQRE